MESPRRTSRPSSAQLSNIDTLSPRSPYQRQDSDYDLARQNSQVRNSYDNRSHYSHDGPRRPPEKPDYTEVNLSGNTLGGNDQPDFEKPGKPEDDDSEEFEKPKSSPARRKWVCCTWFLTWWIPTPFLRCCGVGSRPDVQMAWREKVALCIIIAFMCSLTIFFIAFSGPLICPRQHVFSPEELQGKGAGNAPWLAIRGEVFYLKDWVHGKTVALSEIWTDKYSGLEVGLDTDSSSLFPIPVSPMCDGPDGPGTIDPALVLISTENKTFERNSRFHDYRFHTGDYRPYWYWQQMQSLRYRYLKGYTGISPQLVDTRRQKQDRGIAIIGEDVYDVTPYYSGIRKFMAPPGVSYTPVGTTEFLPQKLIDLFRNGGSDITTVFNVQFPDPVERKRLLTCLRNIYFAGKVDNRRSFRCEFSNYILLAASVMLVSIIGFKFLAALQLTPRRNPEENDKFVIIQIPCYTEGEESLRKTIDSIANLRYDDKRKLLFIIADGMIVGSGNDKTTPEIVLELLGADPHVQPEPLSFLSIGEASKQHNMGKVYSGLYECTGHVVPYIVIAKCGKPGEKQRPGNRGKRDTQMILMRFLNSVHFNKPMTPMELEMYHQIKNVIGVNPSFYEYVLMVDADTEVLPDSLNRMVSCCVHDAKIMGICGETAISNDKDTWVTMIQVYEYYISHHLAKAFESLFGSVTCLPGCFCMYRIRSPNRNTPLLISNFIINDYSENKAGTLHMKNLLSLGEDRYLTTLMMKHFPKYKMKFTADAKCLTIAPETWSTLLSQRRRWINSTVHNLLELLYIPQLCGFCCFSMRFVVFMDLFATVIMPSTVGYLVFLAYSIMFSDSDFPIVSLILLLAVYGLQIILFMLKRQWQHLIWLIIYILAIPIFSFFIPVYAFWHFDDFSWGNTRIVVGEKGKKQKIPVDEEPFDPKGIPRRTWAEYEQELFETRSVGSQGSGRTRKTNGSGHRTRSRPRSTAGSAYGGGVSEYGDDRRRSQVRSMAYPGPHESADYQRNDKRASTMSRYSNVDHRMSMIAPPQGGIPAEYGSYGYPPLPASPRPVSAAGSVNGGYPGSIHSVVPTLGPADDEIMEQVKSILSGADLMQITKKQVRDELSARFGIDMMATGRRQFINQCIESVLASAKK